MKVKVSEHITLKLENGIFNKKEFLKDGFNNEKL